MSFFWNTRTLVVCKGQPTCSPTVFARHLRERLDSRGINQASYPHFSVGTDVTEEIADVYVKTKMPHEDWGIFLRARRTAEGLDLNYNAGFIPSRLTRFHNQVEDLHFLVKIVLVIVTGGWAFFAYLAFGMLMAATGDMKNRAWHKRERYALEIISVFGAEFNDAMVAAHEGRIGPQRPFDVHSTVAVESSAQARGDATAISRFEVE